MSSKKIYKTDSKMRELIDEDSFLLFVISRFGISLGFGDKTIVEVCDQNNVDCNTFLAVANFISGNPYDANNISLCALIDYLKNAHNYFLNFLLPNIRKKLIEVIGYEDDNNISMLLLRYFDDYVDEVDKHMSYENDTVFSYVNMLLNDEHNDNFNISVFSSKHEAMSDKVTELKDIIIRYYPQKNSDLLNSILIDLISCEQDLASHCQIEDKLFIPEVKKLEMTKHDRIPTNKTGKEHSQSLDKKMEMLSDREIEIVKCVAKGMSNKEIADNLCLSIHTVTTHRRNLCTKLGIHSPAGLTIFSIINNLVNLDEIKILK